MQASAEIIPYPPTNGFGSRGLPAVSRDAILFGSNVSKFCRQNDYAKAQWNAYADITESYHRGDMWRYLIRQNLITWTDPKLINGPFDNSFEVALNIQNSTIMGVKMEPECVPVDNDMHSRMAADAGTAILKDHEDRNKVDINRHVRCLMLLLNGLRYVRVGFDPRQVGTITLATQELEQWEKQTGLPALSAYRIPDGRIRASYMMGGTVEHDVHGGCILVDPGLENWSDVERFAVVEYPSVFAARKKYSDVPPEVIQPVYIVDNRNYGAFIYNGVYQFYKQDSATGHRFSALSDMTRTVEFWTKMENGLWDRILMTGPNNEYVLAEEHNILSNPYVCYTARYGDYMYRLSKAPAQALVDPQYLCNSYLNFELRYFQKCPKDIIWVPVGSDDSTGDVSSDFVQRKTYNSMAGQPIVHRMEGSTLQIITGKRREYSADVFAAAGVSPAQRGFAGDRQSGDALETQIQTSDGQLMTIRKQMIAGEEEKNRKVLQFAQQYYTMPRYFGVGVQSGAREFAGTDLRGGTGVRMRLTGTSSEVIAEREKTGQLLLELGAFQGPAQPMLDKYLRFVRGANLEAAQDEEQRLSYLEADREYQAMLVGNVTFGPPPPGVIVDEKAGTYRTPDPPLIYVDTRRPLISPTDMDELHIDRHWQQAHDPHCPPQIADLINYHIEKEHRVRIEQKQQLAQQAQVIALADKSVAEAKGPMVNSLASIEAAAAADAEKPKEKGTPASGGRKSGDTRARKAELA